MLLSSRRFKELDRSGAFSHLGLSIKLLQTSFSDSIANYRRITRAPARSGAMRAKKRKRRQLDLESISRIRTSVDFENEWISDVPWCIHCASYNMLIFASGSNYNARSSPRQDIELISRGIALVATSRMCIIDASARSRSNALADKVRANEALMEAARVCILCMYIYMYITSVGYVSQRPGAQ